MSVMVTNIVLNYIPFRNALYFMFTGKENFSTKFNIICTACFQASICFISIVYPSVSNVLAIFGGIASVNIVYIVPCKYSFSSKSNYFLSFSGLLHKTQIGRWSNNISKESCSHHILLNNVSLRMELKYRHCIHDVW